MGTIQTSMRVRMMKRRRRKWEGLGGKIEKDGYEQGLVNELVLDRRLMLCV